MFSVSKKASINNLPMWQLDVTTKENMKSHLTKACIESTIVLKSYIILNLHYKPSQVSNKEFDPIIILGILNIILNYAPKTQDNYY